jgi:hypothetical protein
MLDRSVRIKGSIEESTSVKSPAGLSAHGAQSSALIAIPLAFVHGEVSASASMQRTEPKTTVADSRQISFLLKIIIGLPFVF